MEKYCVVKLKEPIHNLIKHKSVDMKISIQEIVERALLKFLEDMNVTDCIRS